MISYSTLNNGDSTLKYESQLKQSKSITFPLNQVVPKSIICSYI